MARAQATTPIPETDEPSSYTVVARRYRPQRFEEVVGQDHVVRSLRNALRLNKVTHAYLFSGTRGVGKTSVARIFAKCLNCVRGPTEDPCLVCDICQSIAVGQDVDVIEIDGASNNGVEAVRELRQNASLRPSRARYKIYYIDEVHMLSTGAFNALLKTLEEPPGHVKFFFATTEPNKIPITVLSRCQKYDFAGITPEQIVETLADICTRESIEAEPEALRTVARRAGGSMRDAQSLLEQLLSAGGQRLTVEVVHRLLGTASDERLLDLIDALADRDVAGALRQLDGAAGEGVQPADVLNGLLEFLRDVMVLATGAEATLLAATPRQVPRLKAVVDRWTLDSVLAALQILAEARGRLRGSSHSRLLVELALARVARLENLGEIGDLIGRLASLESGGGLALECRGRAAVKKKLAAVESPPREPSPREPPPRESAPVPAPSRRRGRTPGHRGRPSGLEGVAPQGRRPARRRAEPGGAVGDSGAGCPGRLAGRRIQLGRRRVRCARGASQDRAGPAATAASAHDDPVRDGRRRGRSRDDLRPLLPRRRLPAAPCWRKTRWSRRWSSCSRRVPCTWKSRRTRPVPPAPDPGRRGTPADSSVLLMGRGSSCSIISGISPT